MKWDTEMRLPGLGLIFTALTLPVSMALAAGQMATTSGASTPVSLNSLPAGPFKSSIEVLNEDARTRVRQWLEKAPITSADLDYLRADAKGMVFYADTFLPDAGMLKTLQAEESAQMLPAISASQTFLLHSRPGASRVVYLDFDGHTITGTGWNDYVSTDPLVAKPFDIDNNPGSFSAEELTRIGEIWHRVAEDFAPFDIDVTTELPASFNATTGRILITEDMDANGAAMPAQGAGGVAYIDVFGMSYYPTYSPALVYFDNLGSNAAFVAEAASHEFGHNLGLHHDGTHANGDGSYYGGHGSGYVSWAPIMGGAYYANVTQWSKGEYADANQQEDDLAIIDGKLGYAADDHGDTMGTATPLSVDAAGNVNVSNPETDPHNTQPANKGIIGARTDVDMFSLDVDTGPLSLTVTPAWDAFTRTSSRGANLDVEAVLLDANGSLVVSSDPVDDTSASLSANLSAGRYYLQIDGVGNNVGQGYSDYASLGEYFISGTVVASSATFADVPASYWAYDAIEIMNQKGITTGCGGNLYCPEGLVTRAEMAVFLERAMNGGGFVPDAASGNVFSDVPSSYWAASWVEKLAADGVTGGCSGELYCPGSQVTRAQMAVFLLRSKYGSSYTPPAATGTMFADVPSSYWAASWVEALANEGVTSGCGGNNFCPETEVTRAQMAVFLVNTFGW